MIKKFHLLIAQLHFYQYIISFVKSAFEQNLLIEINEGIQISFSYLQLLTFVCKIMFEKLARRSIFIGYLVVHRLFEIAKKGYEIQFCLFSLFQTQRESREVIIPRLPLSNLIRQSPKNEKHLKRLLNMVLPKFSKTI